MILIAIVGLATVLDLYHLGDAPLTQNESISYAVVESRTRDFVHLAFGYKPEMLLYYLALRSWVALGTSEFALRMLSVIFAVATIPVIYVLGAKLFDVRTGLVAATLLALNTTFTMQAQNARSYSMAAFLVLLATMILAHDRAHPSRLKSVLYILTMAGATYSHTLAILMIPVHWLLISASDSSRVRQKRFAKQMIGLAILLMPDAWLVARAEPDQFNWIPPLSAFSFKNLLSGFAGAPYGPSNVIRRALMLSYAVAIAFGLWELVRALRARGARVTGFVVASAGFVVPTVMLLGVSLVHPLFQFRYLVMALPFFTLLAAAGLSACEYRTVSSMVFSAIVALSIVLQWSIHRMPYEYPWPLLTRTLLEKAHPNDSLIIIPAFLRFPIDYYAQRLEARDRLPSLAYPQWDSQFRVAGEYVEGNVMRGANLMRRDDSALSDAMRADYQRLWIVLPSKGTATSARDLQSIAARYRCHASEEFAELELIRYDNCDQAAPIR